MPPAILAAHPVSDACIKFFPCCCQIATSLPRCRRTGFTRPLGCCHGAALQRRRASRQVLPGVREPPLPGDRPGRGPVELTREVVPPAAARPSCCTPASSCSAAPTSTSNCLTTSPPAWRARGSLGRLGLLTHSTAGFIDPGFEGHVTLELSNMATLPIKLWPGMKDRPVLLLPAQQPGPAPVRLRRRPQPLPRPAWAHASRSHLNFSVKELD